jgi:hypothetical protein
MYYLSLSLISKVLFKGLFFPILLILLIQWNIRVWNKMNWKHFEIYFQVDETIVMEFEKVGIGLFGCWICSLFLYLVLFIGEKNVLFYQEIAWTVPFLLYSLCAIWLFLPFPIFCSSLRFWFVDCLVNM